VTPVCTMDYDIGLRFLYWSDATNVLFIKNAVRPTSLTTIIMYTNILIIRCIVEPFARLLAG